MVLDPHPCPQRCCWQGFWNLQPPHLHRLRHHAAHLLLRWWLMRLSLRLVMEALWEVWVALLRVERWCHQAPQRGAGCRSRPSSSVGRAAGASPAQQVSTTVLVKGNGAAVGRGGSSTALKWPAKQTATRPFPGQLYRLTDS